MRGFLVFFLNALLLVQSLGLCETQSTASNASSFHVVKVARKDLASGDLGRARNDLGWRLKTFDKFYSSQSSMAGESYVVAWNCSGLPAAGETIRLHFEYRTESDSTIRKKDMDIFVDHNGLYETALEHQGEEFIKEGRVESWKVVLLRGDSILDQEVSNLWTE